MHQHYTLLNQNWRGKKSKQTRNWTADEWHIISSRMSWLITTQTLTRSGPVPAQLYHRAFPAASVKEISDGLFLTWNYTTVFYTSCLKVRIDPRSIDRRKNHSGRHNWRNRHNTKPLHQLLNLIVEHPHSWRHT